MNHNTNVKHTTLEDFVTTVNDLGVELVIDEALRKRERNNSKRLSMKHLLTKIRKILFSIQKNIKIGGFSQ